MTDLLPQIKNRYSPLIFQDKPVEQEKIDALLEAARWAPSSYNHQPWRYIVANKPGALEKTRMALVAGNFWAKQAPVLIIVLSKPAFDDTIDGKEYYVYDTGQSVMSLAIEAEHQGLATHQMLGFKELVLKQEFKIPDPWRVLVVIALGYAGSVETYKGGVIKKFGMQAFAKLRERITRHRERKSITEIVSFNEFDFKE
jgi:nitroreductase